MFARAEKRSAHAAQHGGAAHARLRNAAAVAATTVANQSGAAANDANDAVDAPVAPAAGRRAKSR